jgi:hypothetical protein
MEGRKVKLRSVPLLGEFRSGFGVRRSAFGVHEGAVCHLFGLLTPANFWTPELLFAAPPW